MSIKLELPKITDLKPRITVIGVGGAGGNAVNNMIASGLDGVEFIVANTDAQALSVSSAECRIQLGVNLTEGLGAGSKPEIGEAAAEEALEDIRQQIQGSHMVFIAAGMGGGTGTGAASVIARTAREMGILVVAIVTKPFQFEGTRRLRTAEAGIADLRKYVDTMIVIPNQNLFRIANERTTFAEAFVLADQVLYSGIACIVDLIVKEGLINLDFADVRTVLAGMGSAMMGTGEASGDRRAIRAAEEAIANPLLDDVSLRGAKGLLLSIIGDRNLTLYEVDEAASRVRQEVDPDANIIVGATFDSTLDDRIRVSIVASGMNSEANAEPKQRPAPGHAPAVAAGSKDRYEAAPVGEAAVAPRGAPGRQPDMAGGRALQAQLDQVPSPGEAEELARALAAPYQEPAQPPRLPNASPPRAAWESADGVRIKDGLDSLAAGHAPPPLPTARPATPARVEPDQAAFVPQPPVEVRRSSRRMPDLDDFPEVGQRDYQAKQPSRQHPPVQSPPSHSPASPPAASPRIYAPDTGSVRKKPGFFERLTGRGWRDNDGESDSVASTYPQAVHPRPDATPAQREVAAQQRPRTSPSNEPSGPRQDVDLPVFFENKRR